jgi:hypothetical protein
MKIWIGQICFGQLLLSLSCMNMHEELDAPVSCRIESSVYIQCISPTFLFAYYFLAFVSLFSVLLKYTRNSWFAIFSCVFLS